MQTLKTNMIFLLAAIALATSTTVVAVSTKSFVLDSADALFQGEMKGTAVHSDGSVRTGAATQKVPFENVPLAYSMVRRGNAVYVGTGTNGAVYQVDGKKVKELATTGELLVSSLAFGHDGALYAGTLPNGQIHRVDPKSGESKLFSTPSGAKHVWALHYDRNRGRLIAATGPEGKVFAIDKRGNAEELFKADASHVMALAADAKGNLFLGTSDAALVLRIGRDGRASVVYDFPGNEVTAIDVRDGRLAVAANQFKTPAGTQFKAVQAAKGGGSPTRPRAGSGQLWRVERDGRAEMVMSRKDTHFTSVEWGPKGEIYAGGGNEGRIFKAEADSSYSIWIDVEERQVLALDLRSNKPSFVTGDAAAFYRIESGAPKNAMWTSAALDASFPSSWGRLTWRGKGRFVFQTRSGNTKEPGDTWSDWSKDLKQHGRVQSPPARFIQVRAKFPRDPSAELLAIELFYLPQNQRARVTDVRADRPPPKRGEATRRPPPPTTLLNVTWKVDNPDRDPLRYRIAFRQEGQPVWRDMFPEHVVVTDAKYTWNTESVPDGHYVLRVDASDEEANPDDRMLRARALSEPIRVDNHPPRITELSVRKGRVRGRVVDSLGPIARIQIAIDAGPWRDVFPVDALLDSGDERFERALGPIAGGSHIVAVRAFDAGGNQANREITVKTK